MIQGQVSPDRFLLIPIQVYAADGTLENLEAAIDTGFSGYLTLPAARITALQLTLLERSIFIVGDEREVEFDVYSAKACLDGQDRDIFVLETEGDPPLVGLSFLYGSRLHIDLVVGGPIQVENLP